MVQYIPSRDDWGDAGRAAGKNIVEGYKNRADESAIQNAIQGLGEKPSARDVLNAITGTKTYSPESKKTALQNYVGIEEFEELKRHAKEQDAIGHARNTIAANKKSKKEDEDAKKLTERSEVQGLVNILDVSDDHKKVLGDTLSKSGAEALVKEQLKPKKEAETKISPGEKKVQEKQAERYIKLNEEVPKLQTMGENLEYAEKLSNDLGYKGTAAAHLGLSGTASELEAVSFPLIEGIVKIFNPSGPIAQQKLKLITDKYQIKGTDLPWVRQAKIDALKRFQKQALKRAQDEIALFQKYEGASPEDVLQKFEKESNTLTDAFTDYDLVAEEAKDANLPPPKDFSGRTIKSPDGQRYRSDGTRWVKA